MKKDGKKTRLQWLKEGRAVKEGEFGEECYTGAREGKKAVYYSVEQTTADKRKVAKAKRAEKARKEAERKSRQAAEERRQRDMLQAEAKHRAYNAAIRKATGAIKLEDPEFARDSHTAWQWVNAGFVPRVDARWIRAGNGYCYCHWWDVRYEPKRAAALLENGPKEVDRLPDGRPYDGRPWW